MTPHNPENLTEEQIGTADGWRLLDEDEIVTVVVCLLEIECHTDGVWGGGWYGSCDTETYRTKLTRVQLAAKRGITMEQDEPAQSNTEAEIKELKRKLLSNAEHTNSIAEANHYLNDRLLKLLENELLLDRQIDEYRESSQHWRCEWRKASDALAAEQHLREVAEIHNLAMWKEKEGREALIESLQEKIQTLAVHLRDVNKGARILSKRLEIRFAANNEDVDALKKDLKVAHDRIDWLAQQMEVECKEKEHALRAVEERQADDARQRKTIRQYADEAESLSRYIKTIGVLLGATGDDPPEQRIEELKAELLAAQADNVRLRESLKALGCLNHGGHFLDCPYCKIVRKALETTIDTSAIEKVIKALETISWRVPIMGSGGDYRQGQLDALGACAQHANEALALLKGETK